MLRPSRPITRPFMSSLGRATVETTDSVVCAEARRWTAALSTPLAGDAAFRAERPPLHVVAGRGDGGDHRLGGLLRGEALDDGAQHPLGVELRFLGGGALDLTRREGGRA